MDQLPDEILLLVFSFVPDYEVIGSLARVCQRWARVSERQALCVRHKKGLPNAAGVRALLVVGGSSLAQISTLRNLVLLSVYAAAPFGDTDLLALRHLLLLRHLDVFARSRRFDVPILPVAARLSTLVLNDTPAPGSLHALSNSPTLNAIHMFGRVHHYPRRDLREYVLAKGSHLTKLTLRCEELRDKDYAVLRKCEALTELRLYSCWALTMLGAAQVLRLSQLKVLHVSGARMLRSRAMALLVCALPTNLHELALSASWFGDDHASELVKRLPNLRMLELCRCRLTARGALLLARGLPALKDMELDVELNLRQLRSIAAETQIQWLTCVAICREELVLCGAARVLKSEEVVGHADGLIVRAADRGLPAAWLRPAAEGRAASLFYHWSTGETGRLLLPTVPSTPPDLLLPRTESKPTHQQSASSTSNANNDIKENTVHT